MGTSSPTIHDETSGFLPEHGAWNMLPTELKLLRSTDSFCRDLKTFLLHSVYVHQDRIDSVMRPRSSSRWRNTSASITVTVTVTVRVLIPSTIRWRNSTLTNLFVDSLELASSSSY